MAAYVRGTTVASVPYLSWLGIPQRPRVRSSRFARRTSRHSRPPQPIMLFHPGSPLRRWLRASQGGPSSARGLNACLSVLSAILHAQHSDQSSNPKQSPCPELRETEKESLFHVKQRTKPGTKW